MKKLLALFLVFFVFTSISIEDVNAQDDVPKTKFIVWEVKVTPAQTSKLLEAVKFQHEFLKEQNYPYTGFVNYTNDGLFYYSTPFTHFSEIDEMDALDKKLWKDYPEKQKEIWDKFDGNFKSVGGIILELQPEISQLIPPPSDGQADTHFRFFEKFVIKNGKMMEFTEIAKRYKALREKHGITSPYHIYYPKFGPDMSMVYMIEDMGNNPAEHYQLNDEKWKIFGEEGKKLMADFIAVVDKVESHLGTFNNSASYIPSK